MQSSNTQRLTECFRQVFPQVPPASIGGASQSTVAEWDSVAQITLLSLVGESFGLEIDFEEFENATSFATILEFIDSRTGNA
jgi:hypothetical protein